jgi:Zn-dependent protease with chaperone function
MNFEPQVIERIELEKRQAFRSQIVIAAFPLAVIAIAGVITLLLYGLSVEKPRVEMTSNPAPSNLLPLALFLFLIPAIVLVATSWTQRNKFGNFIAVRTWDTYDRQEFQRFRSGLESVSIAAGIPAPELAALELPGACTSSFLFLDGKPHVAVTTDALELPLSDQEAEALMAHEVAHVILGDIIKTPSLLSPERLAATLPLFVACAGLIIGIMAGSGPAIVLFLITFAVVLAGSLSSNVFADYLARLFKVKWRHDDVLADSIAAKITENPEALKSAIEKLDKAGLTGTLIPALGFVRVRDRFAAGNLLDGSLMTRRAESVDTDYKILTVECTAESVVEERTRNLEEIKRGHWQAFEDVKQGRVRLLAGRWE